MTDPDPVGAGGDIEKRITRWLAIASTIITIASAGITTFLTVLNARTSVQISEKAAVLETKRFDLEVSKETAKEQIERYTFVGNLLTEALGEDKPKQTLALNLIRLVLKDEAVQLFLGFEGSSIPQIRDVGVAGTAALNGGYTIYMHFGRHDVKTQPNPQMYKDTLANAGFRIAGIDELNDPYGPGVDYFFEEDKAGAERIAGILNANLSSNEKPFVTRLQRAANRNGVIGVWF